MESQRSNLEKRLAYFQKQVHYNSGAWTREEQYLKYSVAIARAKDAAEKEVETTKGELKALEDKRRAGYQPS